MTDTAPLPAPERADHRFPCDNCGADFRFEPSTGTLTCDFCGNTSSVEGTGRQVSPIDELDFRAAIEDKLPDAEMEETHVSN